MVKNLSSTPSLTKMRRSSAPFLYLSSEKIRLKSVTGSRISLQDGVNPHENLIPYPSSFFIKLDRSLSYSDLMASSCLSILEEASDASL